MLPVTDQL
jgi:hypothetical protein